MPVLFYFLSLKLIILNWGFSGLSYGTDDQSLRDAFSGFGDVVEGEFNDIFSSYKCYLPAT